MHVQTALLLCHPPRQRLQYNSTVSGCVNRYVYPICFYKGKHLKSDIMSHLGSGGDGRICTYSPEGTDLQSAAPRCLRRIPLIGDQYRVVWVAGFEPAASAFRERPSTGLTIHPEIVGRGRAVCMMDAVYMIGCGGRSRTGVLLVMSQTDFYFPTPR